MNLLSAIEPALREVRAPLISGYLWLLAGWLFISGSVPMEDDLKPGTVWYKLNRLEGVSGTIGIVILVSVAAYLVGSSLGSIITYLFDRMLNVDVGQLQDDAQDRTNAGVMYWLDKAVHAAAESDLRILVATPGFLVGLAAQDRLWAAVLYPFCALLAWHSLRLRKAARTAEGHARERIDEIRAAWQVQQEESQRADLYATIAGPMFSVISVENRGLGVARNIVVEKLVEGMYFEDTEFPLEELRPYSEPIHLAVTWEHQRVTPHAPKITLVWDDSYRQKRRKTIQL